MQNILIHSAPDEVKFSANPLQSRAQGKEPHAAAKEGVVLSSEWKLFADDCEVPVYSTPITRGGPHSFAQFDYSTKEYAPVRIRAVALNRTLQSVQFAPKSKGISGTVYEKSVEFTIAGPCHVTLTVNGDILQPLTLSVNPPEAEKPDATDPNVLYFKRGVHQLSFYDIPEEGTIYLEGGSVVTAVPPDEKEKPLREVDWAGQKNYRDCIAANHIGHVTVRGRGILDFSLLSWHARSPLVFHQCTDVELEGITFVNAPSWTVHLSGCKDVRVRNVKLFGYRENSDGIDIVSSQNVRVSDCFVRTGDDAVVVKAMLPPPVCGGKNICVERCVVWNDKVRCFGIAAENRSDISDVVFRDCDVIRSYADWTEELGSLVVYISDKGTVSNILFETIRIEHEVKYATNIRIVKDFWSKDEQAGRIRHVTFRNITVDVDVPSHVSGYDEECKASDIVYDTVMLLGKRAESPGDMRLEIGPFAENITVKKVVDSNESF